MRHVLRMNDLLDLSVIGTAIRLHRNDEAAQYFDNGNHLIFHEMQLVAASPEELTAAPDHILDANPSGRICNKEGIVLIDRYDARSLLQEWEYSSAVAAEQKKTDSFCPIYAGDELDNELLEELMKERFGTLPDYEEIFCCQRTPLSSESPDESIVAATACKADQTSTDTSLILTSEEQSQLPVGITLPQSNRQYQIICMAAEKSNATPQFEILLKVKQSDDKDFGFLREGDSLNPLYLFLKQRLQLQNRKAHDSTYVSKKPAERQSQLLVEYDSSSSDEEISSAENVSGSRISSLKGSVLNQVEHDMITKKDRVDTTHPVSSGERIFLLDHCDLSRKACRLKRARLLKDHFSSQMKDSIN